MDVENGAHVTEQVTARIEPIIEAEGYVLVEVTYRREPAGWVLRLYVDREGGVTVDECAGISRRIGDVIEASDLIPQRYVLEVSSPGLDRTLKSEREFRWAVGKDVRIIKKQTGKGEKEIVGTLLKYNESALTLVCKGDPTEIAREHIAKVKLFVDV